MPRNAKRSLKIFLICFLIIEKSAQARDPFYLSSEIKIERDSKEREEKKSKMCYKVSGIMKIGENYSALVKLGDEATIVHKGDFVGRYTIVQVNQSEVIAKKKNGEEEIWSISNQ